MSGITDETRRRDAIEAALVDAQTAHHVFESEELGGVYDEDWPRWYADHLLDHGLAEHLRRPIPAEELARYLAQSPDAASASDEPPTDPWPRWMAGRMARDL